MAYATSLSHRALLLWNLILASTTAAASPGSCPSAFERLQPEPRAIAVRLDRLANLPREKRQAFFRTLKARGETLRQGARAALLSGERQGQRFYEAIGRQVPREGYVRALSPEELGAIVSDGKMGTLYDFNFRDAGARVGHAGNFVFLVCRKCPPEAFVPGNAGSGVLNQRALSLEELELVIPSLP
ncbi:MAG: hypothetical protein NDJ89_14165 [Oligoflexia bacterium]|nr:hypothetical protein [Oligoflexia bacterium]